MQDTKNTPRLTEIPTTPPAVLALWECKTNGHSWKREILTEPTKRRDNSVITKCGEGKTGKRVHFSGQNHLLCFWSPSCYEKQQQQKKKGKVTTKKGVLDFSRLKTSSCRFCGGKCLSPLRPWIFACTCTPRCKMPCPLCALQIHIRPNHVSGT